MTHQGDVENMADGNVVSIEELRKEKESLRARSQEIDAAILSAQMAKATDVFNAIFSQLQEYGEHFTNSQKNKITKLFAKAESEEVPKDEKPKSVKPDQFILTSGPNKGDTWNGRGRVVKTSFAAWHASDDGKAFVKKTLASEEGKAWFAANSVDGKVKTDEKGQAKGPFPINPAFVEWEKAKDASKAK